MSSYATNRSAFSTQSLHVSVKSGIGSQPRVPDCLKYIQRRNTQRMLSKEANADILDSSPSVIPADLLETKILFKNYENTIDTPDRPAALRRWRRDVPVHLV